MRVYVDAVPLYNLGTIGEVDLLRTLSGELVIPERVRREVDVEPAATNLATLCEREGVDEAPDVDAHVADAVALLGGGEVTADATLVAGVLAERARAEGTPVCGLVSDDRRLRRLGEGLGASVTSTFGVVVRAALADKYFSGTQAKRVLRRMDNYGLVTTGPLRAAAVGDVGEDG